MRAAVVTALTFGLFLVRYQGDSYWPNWLFLVVACLLGMAWNLRSPVTGLHWLPLSLFTWVILNALLVTGFKPGTLGPAIDLGQVALIKELASHAAIEFFVIGFFFFTIQSRRFFEALEKAFVIVGLVQAGSLIIDQLILHRESGIEPIGLLGNRSIGASFVAVWFFYSFHFLFKRYQKKGSQLGWFETCLGPLVFVTGLLSLFISHSGISYFALMLGALWLWVRLEVKWRWVFAFALLIAISAAVVKSNVYTALSRYDAWPMFLGFWNQNFSPWFGSGLGTFKFWGPASQIQNHFQEGQYWLWAHNDWLQIYLELGYVGAALALATWGFALWKTRTRFFLQASILSLGVVMCGNYPLHVAPFAFFIWMISYEVYG